MSSLTLRNIGKSFGATKVLKGIDLEVNDGEFVICVGPSGCGKSTLLRIIAGLENATIGDIRIDDRRVNNDSPTQRGIAMVFQTYALYPHLSVRDNMSLGLKQAKLPKPAIRERVATATAMLALGDYLDRRPAELSGGQRQRVAIGRAVVREPSLFLFDEPLSNLDAALRVNTRLEIAKLHRKLEATIIYVTHDQIEAMTLADRIVVMNAGQVEQIGTPMELYNQPANQFVAGFIGSPQMNFLKLEHFPPGVFGDTLQGAVTLGVRPEDIRLVEEAGDITGTVTHVEMLGGDTNIYIDCAEHGLITARLFGQAELAIDSTQSLQFDRAKLFGFDDRGRTTVST